MGVEDVAAIVEAMAGVEPAQIDCAEVHDCFTPTEIVLMEDLVAAGWSFPDPMELRVSHDDAVAMVEQAFNPKREG